MDHKIIQSNSVALSASLSLTFFWVLNVLKESFSGIKEFLNFYPPVGPLLGLFFFSILVFLVLLLIIPYFRPKNQKNAFIMLIVSSLFFFLLVFPPIFEILVNVLK